MDKMEYLTRYHQELTNQTRYKFNEENIDFFGEKNNLLKCKDAKEIYNVAKSINSNFLTGEDELKDYIKSKYKDFAVTDTTLKNFLKYGYLRDNYTSVSRKKIINKEAVDKIFNENIILLDAKDYFEALNFSIKMLHKVENVSIRFGTFFDKIAKRNGTVLNYIERHMTGKLGETATIKLINNILLNEGSKFKVENSFNTNQVEAADIVQLRDNRGVIVNASSKVQIKTSAGLNSVVLKEDKTKLESETFGVDYCVFVQLLCNPLNFLVEVLQKINDQFITKGQDSLSDILSSIDINNNSILIPTKIAGYISVDDMLLIEKGEKLQPLGEVNTDSYYSYVADLRSDFDNLASKISPR